ncbi:Glucan 1,3-beta-glucosidase 3 [Tulasnella sp. 417]|nr:Glucan 1,3-beta-glucosidase 3 [Tulasnella sp. 417]
MGLLSRIQAELKGPKYFTEAELDSSLGTIPLTRLDLNQVDCWRYRKMRGVNLGSWFTLEPWIVQAPYRSASGTRASDLDVAKGKNAQDIIEDHWENFITDEDWEWLVERGINTVRLPIGYYHLAGQEPKVLKGTDFDGYGAVYASAWEHIKRAIETAGRYGIGVLVDLHAAAGGQNHNSHCGISHGRVHMWDSDANLQSTSIALQFLVRNLSPIGNCVGVELLNEPVNNEKVQAWYERTIACLRRISPDFPIYISDAWDLNWYSTKCGERPDFVIVDHHLYRSFTEADRQKSGDEHAAEIRSSTKDWLAEMSKRARGNLIIGEWSAALHPDSLRSDDPPEQDRQRRVFAQAQLEVFEEHTAGWFFWTYKKEKGWDAGWSFRNVIQAEILPKSFGRKRNPKLVDDEGKRDAKLEQALEQHRAYWTPKGENYEFWRFKEGFLQGWKDAFMFVTFPKGSTSSELGFRGEWLKRRTARHARDCGSSEFLWQFEHGFNEGHDAAMSVYG